MLTYSLILSHAVFFFRILPSVLSALLLICLGLPLMVNPRPLPVIIKQIDRALGLHQSLVVEADDAFVVGVFAL